MFLLVPYICLSIYATERRRRRRWSKSHTHTIFALNPNNRFKYAFPTKQSFVASGLSYIVWRLFIKQQQQQRRQNTCVVHVCVCVFATPERHVNSPHNNITYNMFRHLLANTLYNSFVRRTNKWVHILNMCVCVYIFVINVTLMFICPTLWSTTLIPKCAMFCTCDDYVMGVLIHKHNFKVQSASHNNHNKTQPGSQLSTTNMFEFVCVPQTHFHIIKLHQRGSNIALQRSYSALCCN